MESEKDGEWFRKFMESAIFWFVSKFRDKEPCREPLRDALKTGKKLLFYMFLTHIPPITLGFKFQGKTLWKLFFLNVWALTPLASVAPFAGDGRGGQWWQGCWE